MAVVASIVLFTQQPEPVAEFYRAVGVPLAGEDHGDGAVHLAGEIGGVHIAVLAARSGGELVQGWRRPGSTFVGLWVDSLESTLSALETFGAPVLLGHEACEWGCRIVVADPDGRAVELNEAGHCRSDRP